MLTLLTATGMRPEAWAICEKLMMRQTYQGAVHWIIVDDGEQPQPITFFRKGWVLSFIRPMPRWEEGQNTQARNLCAGLERVGEDAKVAIIEDDDFYAPEYLEDVARWLDSADLVGESRARYFNVATGVGKQIANTQHSSLCSTAVKGPAIQALKDSVLRNNKFIDIDLWKKYTGRTFLSQTQHVVGIKGLPGRSGIGMGHRLSGVAQAGLLQQWIGGDSDLY